MEKRIGYKLEKAIDNAIIYLAQAFSASGHNEKPVISHSFRVGMMLFNYGYSRKIVLAGILHDIIEDTDVSADDLEKEYGFEIANMVSAVSFNAKIVSPKEQNLDVFHRCQEYGVDALIVKCADIIDNIDYFVPTPGYEELALFLVDKYHSFFEIAKVFLANEELFRIFEDKIHHVDSLMNTFSIYYKEGGSHESTGLLRRQDRRTRGTDSPLQ